MSNNPHPLFTHTPVVPKEKNISQRNGNREQKKAPQPAII
jgi:hypothetical protein